MAARGAIQLNPLSAGPDSRAGSGGARADAAAAERSRSQRVHGLASPAGGDASAPAAAPSKADTFQFNVARTLVDDAIHCRRADTVKTERGVRAGHILHSTWYDTLYIGTCLASMAMAYVEKPAMFGPDNKRNQEVLPESVNALLELICVVVFAVDLWLRLQYLGKDMFMKNSWARIKTYSLAFYFGNLVLSALLPWVPRFHRLLRVVFFVSQRRDVQKIMGNIISTLEPVLNVTLLLVLHVCFFGVLAYVLFAGQQYSDEYESDGVTKKLICSRQPNTPPAGYCTPFDASTCSDYFGHPINAIHQMFVLLTTANYPDVMMPAYACNGLAAWFFSTYLAIGLFFLLNLVLAASYSSFQDGLKTKVLEMVQKRVKASDRCFEALALTRFNRVSGSTDGRPHAKELHDPSFGVRKETFVHLMRSVLGAPGDDVGEDPINPGFMEPIHASIEIMFTTLDEGGTGVLTKSDFRQLGNYAGITFVLQSATSSSDYDCSCGGRGFLRLRRRLFDFVSQTWFNRFFDFLVYLTGCMVLAELVMQPEDARGEELNKFFIMDSILDVILTMFVVEILLKYLGLGRRRFFKDYFNAFDLLVIVPSFIEMASRRLSPHGSSHDDENTINLGFVRILRLLRVLRSLRGFSVTVRTLGNVLPFFGNYAVVVFCVTYVFAVIGMECFAGTIFAERRKVSETSYGNAQYWPNNMDNINSAFVTLFELAIVNNWPITMDGFVAATNTWFSAGYFYLYFFAIVVVVLNIFTAHLIDHFDSTRTLVENELRGHVPHWQTSILDAMAKLKKRQDSERPDLRNPWLEDIEDVRIVRHRTPLTEYEVMFHDDIKEFIPTLGVGGEVTKQPDSDAQPSKPGPRDFKELSRGQKRHDPQPLSPRRGRRSNTAAVDLPSHSSRRLSSDDEPESAPARDEPGSMERRRSRASRGSITKARGPSGGVSRAESKGIDA